MIDNLKDLEKLFKLCRKQGITEIDLSTMKFKLGDLPIEPSAQSTDLVDDPYAGFPAGDLPPEQLMFYSSGGRPEDDPALKEKAS